MNGVDPDRFDPYKAMADAALPYMLPMASLKAGVVGLFRLMFSGIFPAAGILFLWLAFRAPPNSYWQSLYLEFSSGFALFWAAPYAFALGRLYRWQVPLAGTAIAALLLYRAHSVPDFLQSVLVEFSTALLLLVALELAMTPWLAAVADQHRKAREELQALKTRAEEVS